MQTPEEIQAEIDRLQIALESSKKAALMQANVELVASINPRNSSIIRIDISNKRPDIVELAERANDGYYYPDGSTYSVPIKNYSTFIISALASLPNVSLRFKTKLDEETIDQVLNGPDIKLDLEGDFLKVSAKQDVQVPTYLSYFLTRVRRLEGIYKVSLVPMSDAASILEAITKATDKLDIEWNPEAHEKIHKLAFKHLQVASISLAEDAPDYAMQLGEYTLRPFQRIGVKFQDLTGGNCIIADEPGLGKSIQAVAYAIRSNKRILIICPASLKENWRRYIIAYTGKIPRLYQCIEPNILDILDMTDLKKQVQFNLMHYDQFSRPMAIQLPNGDRTTRCLWIDVINKSNFDVIVLDEVHKIKNLSATRTKTLLEVKAKAFTGMSGTPILSRPAEFYPVLHLIAPKIFSNPQDFIYKFSDGKNGVKNVQELRKIVAPFMIRRTKDKVMKDLPPIIRTYLNIDLTPKQNEVYQTILSGVFDSIDSASNVYGNLNGTAITNILVQILRLKQYLAGLKTDEVADLAIDRYDASTSIHKKVIVFSQFVPVVAEIAKKLGGESVSFDGSVDPFDRQKIVDKFQTDPDIHFLVCTTPTASEGLNITQAGTVIFADFMWTPAAHKQAEDRAYGRLNDPHVVEAVYVAMKDTVEDMIQELLATKLNTFKEVIDGVNTVRGDQASIAMDIISYLKTLAKERKKRK